MSNLKLLTLALVLLLAVVVIADNDEAHWQAFKEKFGKSFPTKFKEDKHRAAFKKNKAVHDRLQRKANAGVIKFEPAMYSFHDLDPKDMLARMTGLQKGEFAPATPVKPPVSRATFPINYSSVSILGAVRDQGQCGK